MFNLLRCTFDDGIMKWGFSDTISLQYHPNNFNIQDLLPFYIYYGFSFGRFKHDSFSAVSFEPHRKGIKNL